MVFSFMRPPDIWPNAHQTAGAATPCSEGKCWAPKRRRKIWSMPLETQHEALPTAKNGSNGTFSVRYPTEPSTALCNHSYSRRIGDGQCAVVGTTASARGSSTIPRDSCSSLPVISGSSSPFGS